MSAKIIGMVNHKGGCGKTTTAVNMCGMLAEWPGGKKNRRLLLIDMDPQGSANKCIYDGDFSSPQGTLAELLLATPPGRIPLDTYLTHSRWPGRIDFVPSHDESMVEAQLGMMQRHINPVTVLRKLILPVLEMYDYVIIDTGPTQGMLMCNVLYASDYAIVPTILDAINLEELPKTLKNFDRLDIEFGKKPKLIGVLPTVFRKGVRIQEELLEMLIKRFGSLVFNPIPMNTDVQEAYKARTPIHRYNPSAPAVRAYASLTSEVIKRAQKEKTLS
jgi:chromosome partitioning protein